MKLKTAMLMVAGVFLVQTTYAETPKSQRRLVIVSSLETFGMAKYAWLYQFLDASTISLGQAALSGSYGSVSVLPKEQGTRNKFVTVLKNLSNQSAVKAIDVILSVHGSNEKLTFDDGAVTSSALASDLKMLPNRSKFRLLYSLACYGASHRNEFIQSGFRTAIGARKVNTASASEYPAFLSAWKLGQPINAILSLTNADPALKVSDSVAVSMGFNDPDSHKLVSGTSTLTLQSAAQ